MNLEKIKETARNYQELCALAELKFEELRHLDSHYHTFNNIQRIAFCEDKILVETYQFFRGEVDNYSFVIPTEWLTKTGEELKQAVKIAREEREEIERAKKEARRKNSEEDAQKRRFEQYQKLKEEFEK